MLTTLMQPLLCCRAMFHRQDARKVRRSVEGPKSRALWSHPHKLLPLRVRTRWCAVGLLALVFARCWRPRWGTLLTSPMRPLRGWSSITSFRRTSRVTKAARRIPSRAFISAASLTLKLGERERERRRLPPRPSSARPVSKSDENAARSVPVHDVTSWATCIEGTHREPAASPKKKADIRTAGGFYYGLLHPHGRPQ